MNPKIDISPELTFSLFSSYHSDHFSYEQYLDLLISGLRSINRKAWGNLADDRERFAVSIAAQYLIACSQENTLSKTDMGGGKV